MVSLASASVVLAAVAGYWSVTAEPLTYEGHADRAAAQWEHGMARVEGLAEADSPDARRSVARVEDLYEEWTRAGGGQHGPSLLEFEEAVAVAEVHGGQPLRAAW